MEPIIVSIPGEKSPQKQKEAALLASCKYFKGEDECPLTPKVGDNSRALWFVEESWFRETLFGGDAPFAREVEEYDSVNAGDALPEDGRPKTLRARIFNRFAEGNYSLADAAREFAEFYGLWYGDPSGA